MRYECEFDWFDGVTGLLPDILLDTDPRSVRDQLDDRYNHGGGYRPASPNFKWDKVRNVLIYPEDPPMRPVATTTINGEVVTLFEGSWLLIVQPSGEYVIVRVD